MVKVQHETFIPENKELTMQEYEKLVKTAYKKGDIRLALIIETLGSTGSKTTADTLSMLRIRPQFTPTAARYTVGFT